MKHHKGSEIVHRQQQVRGPVRFEERVPTLHGLRIDAVVVAVDQASIRVRGCRASNAREGVWREDDSGRKNRDPIGRALGDDRVHRIDNGVIAGHPVRNPAVVARQLSGIFPCRIARIAAVYERQAPIAVCLSLHRGRDSLESIFAIAVQGDDGFKREIRLRQSRFAVARIVVRRSPLEPGAIVAIDDRKPAVDGSGRLRPRCALASRVACRRSP